MIAIRPDRIWVVGVLVVGVLVVGCGGDASSNDDDAQMGQSNISVSDVWSRPATVGGMGDGDMTGHSDMQEHDSAATPATADGTEMPMDHSASVMGVAYMSIENGGGEDDALIAAQSEVADVVEIHETTFDADVMRMRPVERLDIRAGETVLLEPGGLHVMLVGLKRSLEPGDRFDIDLEFEHAGVITVTSEVREP